MKCKMLCDKIKLLATLTLTLCLCDLVTSAWIPEESDLGIDERFDVEAFHRTWREIMYKLQNSVSVFATYLCREDKNLLIDGVKSRLNIGKIRPGAEDFFVYDFVQSMCKECYDRGCEAQKHILNSWVGIIFDSDGDGVIDNEEKTYIDFR